LEEYLKKFSSDELYQVPFNMKDYVRYGYSREDIELFQSTCIGIIKKKDVEKKYGWIYKAE
ncbi:MAG TPA: hypothetical protein VIM42_07820, partial [Clostridium sp.]